MNWIDIPACSILRITQEQLLNDLSILNEQGEECQPIEKIYRVIRKYDAKIFKMARFHPIDCYSIHCRYLEEL